MIGRILLRVLKAAAGNLLPNKPQVIGLDEINCLVHGRHGWFLANRYDKYLGAALIRYGEFSEIEHRFLISLLKDGDHVIEVGANIGAHTVGLARHVGPSGRIVAIEPQPAIFRTLNANLALNSIDNVTVHACGCGKQYGAMIVPAMDHHAQREHNSGGVSLAETGPGTPVQIIPLDDDLFSDLNPRLLKIDVEGMELEVLQGAARMISKYRPTLYVENDRHAKSKALIEWILAQNYRLWWHMPTLFNSDNYFGESHNPYSNLVSINMFCLPAENIRPIAGLAREITTPDSRWDLPGT